MPLLRSELLVLRRIKLRDSSLMLTCLTRDYGKLSLVARAANRPGSALAESLQYFTVAEAQFYHHEKKSADYISKADEVEVFAKINQEVERFGFGAAALEFAALFLPEEEAYVEVYDLLKSYLRLVDKAPRRDLPRELLHFWLRLTILSGYAPQLDICQCGHAIDGEDVLISPADGIIVCESCREPADKLLPVQMGTLQVLRRLASTDIDARAKVDLTATQVGEIRELLAAMTEYHIGRRATLRSFDYLRKLNLSETFWRQ